MKQGCERWKSHFCLASLVVVLLAVLVRCGYYQYYHGTSYKQKAQRQQLKIIPQTAPRGMIVDRRGRVLAVSTQVPSVRLDPFLILDPSLIARRLGTILVIDADKLYGAILANKQKRFMWVKRFVGPDEAKRILSLKLRGVVVEMEYKRHYPMGTLASHVIGYTDVDGRGLEGVEAVYDRNLAAEQGTLQLSSDVKRRPIQARSHSRTARAGDVVVLTIDAVIQSILEEQLEQTVKKFQAKGATGIVMNPQNGEVYALANWPTFDPARAREVDAQLRRNRALTDPVEPGSLFKPFTIVSALEGGYVTLDETIDCQNGPYRGKGFGVIREYKNYFGSLSVAQVIVRSSNIGAAKIAQKMPKHYFYSMIRKFGFGQKTGIDLNGEGAGILRPLREWKWGQYALTRAAFGQGPVAVTGIQLIRGFSCLANGGRLVRPKVVKGILDSGDYHVVRDFGKSSGSSGVNGERAGYRESDRVISEDIAREFVRRALTAVVERKQGTAHNAYLEEYRVFGKTGTAQVAQDGVYQDGMYVSSFIGAAPQENPSICVLIMVHQPDKSLGLGYTGGAVAAKPVGIIIRESLAYLNVPRTPSEQPGAESDRLARGNR